MSRVCIHHTYRNVLPPPRQEVLAPLPTLHIVLEDLGEDQEQRLLEAGDGGRVGSAGDSYGQADGLEQVMVEVRLAGILEGREQLSRERPCMERGRQGHLPY